MIIFWYLAVGAIALALILLSKSHRVMNAFSVLHALAFLAIGLFALLTTAVPALRPEADIFMWTILVSMKF